MIDSLDINSPAVQYGYGAFETILVSNSVALNLKDHYNRFKKTMMYLQIEFEISYEELDIIIKEYIINNNLEKRVIKISGFLNSEIILTNREYSYSKNDFEKGYKLCLSEIKRHSENPIYQIKSNNMINNFLELKKIKEEGFNEVIHLNEKNNITEGIFVNIFFVKNKKLYTPHVSCGLLPGILRMKVIDLAKKIGIPIEIGYYNIEDIKEADEVFLTNSLIGIMKVNSYENINFDLDKFSLTNELEEGMLYEFL